MSDPAVDLRISVKAVEPSGPPLMPTPGHGWSSSDRLAIGLDLPSREPTPTFGPRSDQVERRTMVVGAHVSVSGDIAFCDTLRVAGNVEASLHECRELEISAGGMFKGNATAGAAQIRGRFEGDLVVRKRLIIHSTAYVSGSITYGAIEIRSGAEVAGILMPDRKAGTSSLPPTFAKPQKT
jgi:cytoskeletal protein CcmA (bactofilin family)